LGGSLGGALVGRCGPVLASSRVKRGVEDRQDRIPEAQRGAAVRREHLLWVLVFSLLLTPTTGWSEERADMDSLRACLRNWGNHPFDEGSFGYRTVAPSVRVFGIGPSVRDDRATERPELVLVKPSVSVFSSGTLSLLNPQGWYCLQGKVAVFSAVDIRIDCRTNLASSIDGATVLGSNDRKDGVTVFGTSSVTRTGCDRPN
jgi:hypothetical protein